MSPGKVCFVQCNKGMTLRGKDSIVCQYNSKWSSQPKCVKAFCPSVVLQDDLLELKENCSTKTVDEVCEVSCKNDGKLIEGKKMKCLEDFRWSESPRCACATPYVSKSFEEAKKCDFIPKKERCSLRCKIGYNIIGPDYIECQNNGKWGVFPKCQKESCPDPVMKISTLELIGKCSEKKVGQTCLVHCVQGGRLLDINFIKCFGGGKWGFPFGCSCPSINISNGLIMKGDCSLISPGKICFVECSKSMPLIGPDRIVCQNNGKWGVFPKCQKESCPEPVMKSSTLELIGKCSEKKVGQTCLVHCVQGGRLLDINFIKCFGGGKWGFPFGCSCPSINISNGLITKGDCSVISPGNICFFECSKSMPLIGPDRIVCQNNGKWGVFPTCQKESCAEPVMKISTLELIGKCSEKKVGQTCLVHCVQGGRLLDINFIKCFGGGKWGFPLGCSCPSINISNGLIMKGDCSVISPGKICFVECSKNLPLIGPGYILCQNNGKWGVFPTCQKNRVQNL
ncbi:sushi, von Willebrand factor type A, EGF and pentraxin domain-containing protein 1 [Trichonephila inaurata madagascariensis]|uniref:Sushi, von Willebrand factor type A, EGF and pentraxin domain-containing protein 1 n=1 Tax=Trichonephila inaurata madagascariensis TaxID=2747483 RepID=A0A8X7CU49_9ARAC|nr:sushi, von Willebrand factor type A, EGF and pentraxin domain-containing protein 1 [Trichonephila inaurata madagascariensis]